ncbi:hypothetical protein A3Q56_06053, partial [Intoshia linei]
YGLCCIANDDEAVKKLYEIKNRPINKPISICFGSVHQVCKFYECDHTVLNLLNSELPGSYTFILNMKPNQIISRYVNVDKKDNIGFRIPESQLILDVCKQIQMPLALTSANLSGELCGNTINSFEKIWNKIDLIITEESKKSLNTMSSTVLDLSGKFDKKSFKIIRCGMNCQFIVDKLQQIGFYQI